MTAMVPEVPPPAVSAQSLVLGYGGRAALASSDFVIPADGLTALIGPNGSGKSTILNAIAGLLRPISGRLAVPAVAQSPTALAYVLQATLVNAAMPITVREVVGMGRYASLGPFQRFTSHDRALCSTAMERLDIAQLASRHLHELSGGQRQRVFVAQGLAQAADLLLLDEPITGLDLPSSERIRAAIRQERDRGVTVVLTTHELADAAAADWVLLLAGRVVAAGPPQHVLTSAYLEQAYGVAFRAEGGQLLIDDAAHRPRHGSPDESPVSPGSGTGLQ
jgi:ABC-type Mn2+/Zn2+ transport system ATPase subunit